MKAARVREGWTRVGAPPIAGKGATVRHDASGWVVEHCGHPTAIWPYFARHDSRPDTIAIGEECSFG